MEAPSHNPDHAPQRIPSKRERVRKIKAIRADIDLKRRELGMQAPSMKKGPVFYLGLMAVLAILGLSVIAFGLLIWVISILLKDPGRCRIFLCIRHTVQVPSDGLRPF